MAQTSDKPPPPPEGRVADATPRNWVDRFAPGAVRPYLRLSRADRPAGTWLLLIPCLWGLALGAAETGGFALSHLWIAIGCGIGAFLMRGAGCTWNDLSDQHFDAAVERTKSRPLPSGQVSRRGAVIWLLLQTFMAFGILLTFPAIAIILGVLSLGPVALYPFAKRFTWWPQVFLGIAFNWGVLLAYAAVTGGLQISAILFYLAGITWTLFYDTIYAHQDREDDALIGVKSTARLFGTHSPRWLAGFLVVSVVMAALAVVTALTDAESLALMAALAGTWGFGLHLWGQLRRLDINDPDICLSLFRSNRDAGFILAIALAAAAVMA